MFYLAATLVDDNNNLIKALGANRLLCSFGAYFPGPFLTRYSVVEVDAGSYHNLATWTTQTSLQVEICEIHLLLLLKQKLHTSYACHAACCPRNKLQHEYEAALQHVLPGAGLAKKWGAGCSIRCYF